MPFHVRCSFLVAHYLPVFRVRSIFACTTYMAWFCYSMRSLALSINVLALVILTVGIMRAFSDSALGYTAGYLIGELYGHRVALMTEIYEHHSEGFISYTTPFPPPLPLLLPSQKIEKAAPLNMRAYLKGDGS